MTLKCLIIDDKPLAIDLLNEYVIKVPFLHLVASTTDPLKGLDIIRTQPIDLVFLDIQMPQLSGLQFLNLADKNIKVIFTTAYAKYAIDGYNLDVVDYLLKPFPFDRFYQAAEKALRRMAAVDFSQPVLEKTQSEPGNLFVKTEHRLHKVDLAELLYVEGLENYVSIQTASERILSLQTLKRMEEQLPSRDFLRVHRSYIISLKYISYIEKSTVLMQNGITIPIGNSYRESFFSRLKHS